MPLVSERRRARTFAVHVVAIGTGVLAAQRAASVLTSWTRDGDGQGAPDLDTPTKADPDIRSWTYQRCT